MASPRRFSGPSATRAVVSMAALAAVAACGGGDGGVDAPPGKRFFTTSAIYDGQGVGGLAGADAKCNLAALSGDLGGTWVAWLSDSTTDAIDRIPDVGPWYLVNGYTLVFAAKSQLVGHPLAHLPVDELGDVLSQEEGQGRFVWTGTVAGGTRGASCADWTDATIGETGAAGDLSFIDERWTDGEQPAQESCNLLHHLYCFEQ